MDVSYLGTAIMVLMFTSLMVVRPNCSPQSLTLYESPEFDEYVLWEKTSVNRISCGVECGEDSRCVTFQYYPDRLLCRAFPVGIDVMDRESEPSFKGDTFMLKERESGSWQSACAEDYDCSVANTECRDSKCLCKIGYRFNPKMSLCGEDCATYGNDFTTHAQHFISYNDYFWQNHIFNLSHCMWICTTYDNCTSVDYNVNDSFCGLQSVGWFDVPKEDRNQNSSGWTFAQRNCKE